MRAAVYFKHGQPEDVLQAVEVEDPKHPGHGEVLIRVLLRPVHHGDLLGVAGRYQPGSVVPEAGVRLGFEGYGIVETADNDAVLVIDETGFLKQGKTSCGVSRQYTGSAGKITNCQIGAFTAYVSGRGHAFIDRALYLPKSWTSDPARLAAAHVPEAVAFATKPALAVDMIRRALVPGATLLVSRLLGSDTSSECQKVAQLA